MASLTVSNIKSSSLEKLILHPKREKSILTKHHWIFSGAVKTCNALNGDIVSIHASSGTLLGYGFYDNNNQIACRQFEWTSSELIIDKAYWTQKIKNAYSIRKDLIDSNTTTSYRLLHAEGDFLPGMVADVYNDIIVVQPKILGIEKLLPTFKEIFNEIGFQYVYIKSKSASLFLEQLSLNNGWMGDKHPSDISTLEHGFTFPINIETGQKTGFFIDQRENRLNVKHRAEGKTVLNAFSYTGGFSLYALAGGATHVDSVDISSEAIHMANELVKVNGFAKNHRGLTTADCFDFLNEMPSDHYDLIILDPPAFAKHKRAIKNASQGYKQINLKAMRKIKAGGLLYTFSCSKAIDKVLFQRIVFNAAIESRREVRIIQQLHQPEDHPINIFHPETEYLKGLLLYVS